MILKRNDYFKSAELYNKGFTLIELLAVILILGILLLIAIPSVTSYIGDSRKEGYITVARQITKGAIHLVNSGELDMFDTDTTYYIPASCVPTENGLSSPYGDFDEAYVIVGYNGDGYEYYWASTDVTKQGIEIKNYTTLERKDVKAGIDSIDETIGIGERNYIRILDDSCRNFGEQQESKKSIDESGEVSNTSNTLYSIFVNEYNSGGLVKIYSGDHKDSFTSSNNNTIYYWYADNTNQVSSVNNKIIFAGFCWELIRTTDLGGVKIMYSGVPNNGTCNNSGAAATIGTSQFNSNYYSPSNLGYMYNIVHNYDSIRLSDSILFGNRFRYENGRYYLIDTITTNTSVDLSNHHYTCLNNEDNCTTLKYVYQNDFFSTSYLLYMNLNNGKDIQDILYDTFRSNDVNRNNSSVKQVVDNWFQNNMTSYLSKIDDVVYCSDRTYKDLDTSGWNPNGGLTSNDLHFAAGNSLKCPSELDSFSLSNPIAKLTYPVGLPVKLEMSLYGKAVKAGINYWIMTPDVFGGNRSGYVYIVEDNNGGHVNETYSTSVIGVRPVIALKKDVSYKTGDGTPGNPYRVTG